MDMKFEKHCWAEIDLDALRHNFAYIRQAVGGPVCAVVKADAYGHGDVATAKAVQQAGVTGFAVSSLGEGHHLRHHGITVPILILGYADPAHAATLAEDDIATACFSTEYAQALSAAAVQAGVRVKVHIKIDTGMGRIGFAVRSGFEETIREVEALYALPGLAICGIFQHFAVADSDAPDDLAYTEEQYDLFTRVVDRLQADGYATGTAGYDPRRHYPVWAGSQRGCPLPGAAACPFSALYRHFCERAAARPMCELRPDLHGGPPHAGGNGLCRLC